MKNVISYILFFSILLLCACSSDDAPSSDAGLSCSDVLGNYSSQNEFSSNQQSMEFDYCYPSDLIGEKFSLSNYSEKILLIEMSASW